MYSRCPYACFPKFSGPGAHGVASAILQYFTLLTGTYDPHFNNNYDNNNNHDVIILLLLITKVIQMTIGLGRPRFPKRVMNLLPQIPSSISMGDKKLKMYTIA